MGRLRVCCYAICAMLAVWSTAAEAEPGGFGAALQEARLVSSYFQFARRCQIGGAISHEELMDFRSRLLNALLEKYGLDTDDEAQIIRVVDDDSVVIATAGLPVQRAICMQFMSSI